MKITRATPLWPILLALFSLCNRPEKAPPPPFPVQTDWHEALARAEAENKPMLIIFDWFGSAVDAFDILREPSIAAWVLEKYIVVWAAVDNPKPLPRDTTCLDRAGRRLQTYGQCYGDLQRRNFEEHFQPMYALFSPQGKPILKSRKNGAPRKLFCGYAPATDEKAVSLFKTMLEEGLENF